MLNILVNWARYDSWRGKLLRLPLNLLPKKTIVTVVSGKSRGKKWIVGSADHGAWLGTYESEKQFAFSRFVRQGMVVYDIGAHVGVYTILASTLVGVEGRVIAFEPLPHNLFYLHKHLKINSVNNVSVIETALSDKSSLSTFAVGQTSSMGRLDSSGSLTVQSFTLDEIIHLHKLPIPEIIKMDIEGGEADALKGAAQLLSKTSPIIFLATHGEAVREECRTFLASLAYDMDALIGDTTGTEFIAQRRSSARSTIT